MVGNCPDCGAEPTDDSVVDSNLSSLGYLHEDVTLVCSECDFHWTRGLPRGETTDNTWVCNSCNGNFIPHFVYVHPDEESVRIKPKCEDCYYVPDNPIELDCSVTDDTNVRFFVGHHTVTGNRDDAETNDF